MTYKNKEKGAITEKTFNDLMSGEPKVFKFQGETRKVDNVLDTAIMVNLWTDTIHIQKKLYPERQQI